MNRFLRCMIPGLTVACFALSAGFADAQVVYYSTLRPVVAAPLVAAPVAAAPAYVANYTPTGNYAAVTAYSPPVLTAPAAVAVTANYAPAVAPVAVTSYYAPTVVNYAPAPTVAYSPVVAPVTTYYAPTAVAAPLYRRGLFGGLRPVRNAYYIAY
ncbi:MAG: hypothetical protein O3A18_10625 [Planctomycetota bacterium]|jgi:hypothetical protein|nr:hypothetical protein [Planctomycetota bacterium]